MPDAAPPPTDKPKVDPFLASLTKSLMGATLDDEFNLKPLPTEKPGEIQDSGLTVSEKMAEAAKKLEAQKGEAKPEAKPDANPPEEPKPEVKTEAKEDKPAAPPAEAKKEEPKPEVPIVKPASDEILEIQRKIKEDMDRIHQTQSEILERQRAEKKPEAAEPEKPSTVNPDDDFDKTLPEEAQEVMDVLKWAEKQPEHKGKASEYRSYLRRLDEFSKSNPDEDALRQFELENKPKIGPRLIRTLREEQIIEKAESRALEKARKEQDEKLSELRQKQYEMEIKPVIEKSTELFKSRFTAGEKADGKIDPEVARKVLSGSGNADEEHPLEAPILRRHAEMFKEYLGLVNGLVEYDPQKRPVQTQVVNFITRHEQRMMTRPETERLRDGRRFVPLAQFSKLPQEQQSNYWTFGVSDIEGLMEQNAHLAVDHEKKKIAGIAKKMGFSEPTPADKKPDAATQRKEEPIKATPKADEEESPKATASKSPGAAKGGENKGGFVDAISSLVPNARELIS
jgi:hypothetical protein